jgi:F420H(2)-dependent quinone reductase
VVVAANDGAESDPDWYLNLAAEPSASVEVEGRRMAVRADEMPADGTASWWRRIVEISPEYERYARDTSRRFAVMRLVPEG